MIELGELNLVQLSIRLWIDWEDNDLMIVRWSGEVRRGEWFVAPGFSQGFCLAIISGFVSLPTPLLHIVDNKYPSTSGMFDLDRQVVRYVWTPLTTMKTSISRWSYSSPPPLNDWMANTVTGQQRTRQLIATSLWLRDKSFHRQLTGLRALYSKSRVMSRSGFCSTYVV